MGALFGAHQKGFDSSKVEELLGKGEWKKAEGSGTLGCDAAFSSALWVAGTNLLQEERPH